MARAVILLFLIAVTTNILVNAAPQAPGQCGPNERFDSCGSSCEATCEEPTPRVCTLACIPGCYCSNGFVKNAQNQCVPLQSCH